MLERDGYPAGVPCWIDTSQPDPEAATAFYGGLFGWEFEDRMPAGAPGHYFVARLRGLDVAAVGSQPAAAPPIPVWSTYIWVESADAAAASAAAAGGAVRVEPFDVADAGRMAVLADPYGAVFSVWQARRHRGAQLVNEPGSWNWSDLYTRHLEGSAVFYGALFGWQARPVDFGDGGGTMWCLPGYADVLAAGDPDLRRRHADLGAPEGFSDAVGWMVEMTGDVFPDDVPPHWGVTFSVDDCDAAAERAAGLGGEVTVGPFDAGPTRVAGLRDPQGATFAVSRYDPG